MITDFASRSNVNWRARAVGHQVGVLRRFLAAHGRLIHHLEAPQPLDVGVALPPGQQEPQRISLLRPKRLAVLAIGDHRVVHHLFDRDAAVKLAGVRAFGEDPRRAGVHAALTEQRGHRHAGPLAAAREAVDALHVRLRGAAAPFAAAVAGAFEEVDARDRRQPLQLLHGEDQRPIDHAVNGQRVPGRIDLGDTAMMPLEVQRGRRDDAVGLVQRRTARRLLQRHLRVLIDVAHRRLEPRARSVRADRGAKQARAAVPPFSIGRRRGQRSTRRRARETIGASG